MSLIWWFVLPFIWLALAFWTASVAASRGHSPALFFTFSLFLFPIALILAYLLPRGGPERFA